MGRYVDINKVRRGDNCIFINEIGIIDELPHVKLIAQVVKVTNDQEVLVKFPTENDCEHNVPYYLLV